MRSVEVDAREYDESVQLVREIRDIGKEASRRQVRHWSLPANQISADFFCSVEHPEKGWYGLLADTAGHGLSSAIFSLQAPMLFRTAARNGMSLPEICDHIHASLRQQQLARYFVCGLLMRIHHRDIEIINAGMPDALLLAPGGHLLATFPSSRVALGIETANGADERGTGEKHYRLARGEAADLLLFSDGLVEAGVPGGSAFGMQGILAAVADGTDTLLDRLVERFADHALAAHDDVSIMQIRVPLDVVPGTDHGAEAGISEGVGTEMSLHIVENFPRGLLLTDAGQRILYVNPAFTAITGYAPEDVLGRTPRVLSSGRQGPEFYQRMWQGLRENGAWSGELWNRRKDGQLYLEWADIHALRDAAGHVSHYLAAFSNITEQRRLEESAKRQLLHDTLTGLANTILLADRGEQAMRRADRTGRYLGVLFINLDRFNSINNSLGHDIGDQVLGVVAGRFATVIREDDTLARYGGDEFVCLLPDIIERKDAGIVAGKLLAVLDEPVDVSGHRFKIGASIGVSLYPTDSLLFDDLVVLANRSMSVAKRAGGNIIRFHSSEASGTVEKQLEMEAHLDAAIRNDELELHYQPKLDLSSRQIIGAEALVRWRDPRRGLVPPGEFIPVAERSYLIAKIGNWVINKACSDIARWEAQLPADFHVAVNVSPMQLARCDLVGELTEALAASGIAPPRLQIEVTESLFIKDAKEAAAILQGIADIGVSLALDDFGTGYSNLGSLSRLPLDIFKLDQTFVRGIHDHQGNRAIAKAIWHLADGMGKEVIAEGIETCKECYQLREFGYRIGQGYLYGKPMPETSFLRHLAGWRPGPCTGPDNPACLGESAPDPNR